MGDIDVPHLSKLVQRLGIPLSVYDLESAAFRGSPNFGIVEVAICSVLLDGRALMYSHLINPETQIESGAYATHKISQAMVRDKETWGKRYAAHFHMLAKDHVVSGFNITGFDNHAVIEQNARYGIVTEKFHSVLDARHYYRHCTGTKSLSGNLETFAAKLGLKPKGRLHRAEADVYLTVDMLEELVRIYGEDAFIAYLEEKNGMVKLAGKALSGMLTPEGIAACVHQKGCLSVAALCAELKCEPAALELPLCKAIDRGLVDPMLFSHAPTRQWMRVALATLLAKAPFEGRLKPVYEALLPVAPAGAQVNYLQLRIGLLDAGYTWGMLNQGKIAA